MCVCVTPDLGITSISFHLIKYVYLITQPPHSLTHTLVCSVPLQLIQTGSRGPDVRKRSELLIGQQEHKGREAVTLVNLKNVMTLMTFLQVCFSVVLFSCVSSTCFISFGMWPLPDHQDHEPQWDVMVKQRHEIRCNDVSQGLEK